MTTTHQKAKTVADVLFDAAYILGRERAAATEVAYQALQANEGKDPTFVSRAVVQALQDQRILSSMADNILVADLILPYVRR